MRARIDLRQCSREKRTIIEMKSSQDLCLLLFSCSHLTRKADDLYADAIPRINGQQGPQR